MSKSAANKQSLRKALILERHSLLYQKNTGPELPEAFKFLRLNPLRAEPKITLDFLVGNGVLLQPEDWLPHNSLRLTSTELPGARDALQTCLTQGTVFMQNPSSLLAVQALEPRPDQQIADLCASPGGKSSYIAALTNNQASLWCNDVSKERLARLRKVCALLNTKPTRFTLGPAQRASKLLPTNAFDSVLIDAPCSGEDIRLLRQADLGNWSMAKVKRLSLLQRSIIKDAWHLVKPGGKLVYSTCSAAPEENEGVIDWFLKKHQNAEVAPVHVAQRPNFHAGLKLWQNTTYNPQLVNALRVEPDEYFISFFVCVLSKTAA